MAQTLMFMMMTGYHITYTTRAAKFKNYRNTEHGLCAAAKKLD
jgi:hypothetical protein